MKNSMRLICLLLVLVLVFMSGCAQQSPNETNDADQENNNQQVEETIVLKAGIPNAIGHPHYKGLEVFKAQMEEKSNGRVTVDLFPAGQLGAERDLTEGLQSGTLDLSCITFGVTASFAPELNVFGLPFLFRDSEHYQKVVSGEIGAELAQKIQDKNIGLKIMGYTGPVFRVPFTKKKPLNALEDLKGLKIRTMEVPVHMATYKSLGASPIPIAYTELYTSLQLGTVDAAENAIATIYADKLYEQAQYVYKVPVVVNGLVWLYSDSRFKALPEDVQDLILEVMPDVVKATDDAYLAFEGEGEEKIKEAGITVNEVDDLKPFVDSVQNVWEEEIKKLPDWASQMVEDIQALK